MRSERKEKDIGFVSAVSALIAGIKGSTRGKSLYVAPNPRRTPTMSSNPEAPGFLTDVGHANRTLKNGTVLFRAGDRATRLFRLQEGAVRLERTTPDGQLVVTGYLEAGDVFPVASLFSDRYHCDAVVTTGGEVEEYASERVLGKLTGDAKAGVEAVHYLALQIRRQRELIEILRITGADDRVMAWLRTRSRDGVFELPGDAQTLAAQLSMARETLYRSLSRLAKTGRIKRSGSTIRLRRSVV